MKALSVSSLIVPSAETNAMHASTVSPRLAAKGSKCLSAKLYCATLDSLALTARWPTTVLARARPGAGRLQAGARGAGGRQASEPVWKSKFYGAF